jgi:hypothetical protein
MIQVRKDGSFIIDTVYGPNTYHVPNEGEWKEQWAELKAQRLTNPELYQDEPPPAPPPPPTDDQLRQERNSLLGASDKYMVPDYPISDTLQQEWKAYRQTLRDDFKARPTPPATKG